MDVVHSCRCCLRRAPDKDLTTPYTHLGNTEIYSDMLKECFEIHLLEIEDECGICEVCVGRLRDASDFKLQVQRSQAELQARLQGALQIKDEKRPVKLEVDYESDKTSGNVMLHEKRRVKLEVDYESDNTSENVILHEEFMIKSELEEQHTASEDQMSYKEPAVKLEEMGDAVSDDDCASRDEYSCANARPRAEMGDAASDDDRASLAGAESARPVSDASCVKLERLRGDEAPRASQTCLATSRRGPRRASRMKDLPDDTAGARAEEQAYTCDTCGEQFADKSRLIKHIQAHGTPADKLSRMNIYTKHVNTHMNNRTDTHYYVYDAKFSTKFYLNSHVGTHKDGMRYPCEVCNKTFVNNSALKRHKKIHTEKQPFTCDECYKQFQNKSSLIKHVRVHTGIKPYSCKECNKQFTQKHNLDSHTITHTGVKPYSCELCNKQFTQKGNLNRHRKIHNGEKPYGCEECGKHFTQKNHLNHHKKIHTGEKPYSCTECNKQFTHKFSIIRHKRVHTRDKLL